MIEGWAEVHRQHDVCEFSTFLMKHCDCSLFSGSWQARMPAAAGDMRLIDAGLCTQPIILYIPQHRPNMAIPRLADDWHRCVDRFHGLQVVPPVLMLQLHRFQQQRGATIKNRGNVRLDDVIRVPVFQGRGGSMVHHVQYTLAAFIEHHGDTPISGHYTATLVQENFGTVMTAASLKPDMFSKISNCATVTLFSTGFNLISVLSDHSSSGGCACLQVLRDGAHLVVLLSR